MLAWILFGHWRERIQPDMQCQLHQLHTHRADAVQQFGSEMQPSRGSCRRTGLAGVHRLVALGLCERCMDIGWQRDVPHPLQIFFHGSIELYEALGSLQDCDDLRVRAPLYRPDRLRARRPGERGRLDGDALTPAAGRPPRASRGTVIVAYDGDAAGVAASYKAFPLLLSRGRR